MNKLVTLTIAIGILALQMLVVTSCRSAMDETAPELYLTAGWDVQSSDEVDGRGELISTAGYTPENWYKTSVPATVLAVLVQNGVYDDPYFGRNLRSIPGSGYPLYRNFSNLPMPGDSPFRVSWWYRKEFRLPPEFEGQNLQLHFKGINYRANIWMNGKLLADTNQVAGAYRIYEFDINEAIVPGGNNCLAVEVFAPRKDDLAITWVEWNPAPPDKDMGIWHDVLITATGPVALRHPAVETSLDLPSLKMAHLTVRATLRNTTTEAIHGILRGEIGNITFGKEVALESKEQLEVSFDPGEFEQLNIENPRIWWPLQYGNPELYTLSMSFETGGKVSDARTTRFGIRQVTSELTGKDWLLYKINGKKILIRGGGWAPDMMLRPDSTRMETELKYVRDMNLNAIRLEGKLENDYFYDLCDRMGILVLPGWCCCHHWERWKNWDDQDYLIATRSMMDQSWRLRNHASVITWLYGSDYAPPADVEQIYLDVLHETHFPNPTVSSAANKPTELTGPSGIRMEGPYFYTEPSYWYVDTTRGGAFGFNAEIGPGASIPVLESIREMFPGDSLWPINEMWHYHARGGTPLHMLDMDTEALNARFGEATTLEDYVRKSQLQAYEGKRAMFEAYRRNKYVSTGVIHWMMNDAWPRVYWNLYDYFLRTGGSYYGTKKANEPLHIQYSYDDRSVVVVNSTLDEYRGLKASARILNLDLEEKFDRQEPVDIGPDGMIKLMTLPEPGDLSTTYFVRLELEDQDGKVLSSNFYWLSTAKEVFNWEKSYFWATPMTSFPDYTALQALPMTELSESHEVVPGDGSVRVHITISNPTDHLALAVNCRLKDPSTKKEIIPVLYQDNYFPLFPGENRRITAGLPGKEWKEGDFYVEAGGWNVSGTSR